MKNYKFPCCFISVFLCLFFLSSAFAGETHFKDVTVTHWAYGAVENLVRAQIIRGFPDHTFKPEMPVSREQFAAVLTLSLKLPINVRAPQTFADVERSHWAFLYIDAAKSYIQTPGNPKGSFDFNGGRPITREEAAAAVAGAVNLKPDPNADSSYLQKTFKDYRSISPEYQQLVALAVFNKVMSGNPDGTFRAKGFLTRAEICALFNKLLNDIEASKPKKIPKPWEKPHQPWTLEFIDERPDYDLVKSFTGIVSKKVYGPTDYYLVLNNDVLHENGINLITRTVNMYVYKNDLQWFYPGDMLKVDYNRKSEITSYGFEREAKPHPYRPPVGGK